MTRRETKEDANDQVGAWAASRPLPIGLKALNALRRKYHRNIMWRDLIAIYDDWVAAGSVGEWDAYRGDEVAGDVNAADAQMQVHGSDAQEDGADGLNGDGVDEDTDSGEED